MENETDTLDMNLDLTEVFEHPSGSFIALCGICACSVCGVMM